MRPSSFSVTLLLLACTSAFAAASAESPPPPAPAACVVEVSPQTLGGVFVDPGSKKPFSSIEGDVPQQSANRVPDAVRGLVDLKVSLLATPESSEGEKEETVPAGWELQVSLPESASVVFATNMELVSESSPPPAGSRSARTYEGAATERAVAETEAAKVSGGGDAATEAAASSIAAAAAPRTATFVAPAEWQALRPGAQPISVAYQVEARSASFEPEEVSLNGVKCAVVRPGGASGIAAAAGARVAAPELPLEVAGEGEEPSSSSSSSSSPLAVSASDRPVSTNGSQLIGVDGKPFTIVGVNYFGFENGQTMVDGLWAQTGDATVSDFATVVWRLRLLGFNAVRLPFSFQEFSKTPRSFVWSWCSNDTAKVVSSVVPPGTTLPAGAVPPPLDSPAPAAKTPMTCNDYVPATSVKARLLWASKFFAVNGFYVVLDDHMIYDTLVLDDPSAWTRAWGSLAADIAADPVLKNRVMFDLLNEPDSRGITWRSGPGKGGYGMDALYEMAADAVYAANPTALMLFEGTGQLGSVAMNWGDGFATDPAVVANGGVQSAQPFFNMALSKPWASNVVISPHLYPPSVSTHREVDQVTGTGLFTRLSNSFGYLTKRGVCSTTVAGKCKTFPVVFGETGSKFTDSLDVAMLNDFAKYMRTEDAVHAPILNMFWWSWNANSGDTGGIVGDDWRTVWWNKVNWLERASALVPWWRVASGSSPSPPPPPPPPPPPTAAPTPPATTTPPKTTTPPATTKPPSPPPPATTTPPATTKPPATPPPTTTPPKTTVPPPTTTTPKPTTTPTPSFACSATITTSSWQSGLLYYSSLNIAISSAKTQAVPYPVSLRIASAVTVDSAWNWAPAKLPTAGWVTGKVKESWQAMGVGKPASLGLIVAGTSPDLKPTAVSVSGTFCSVSYA